MPSQKYIRISLEDLKPHLDHSKEIMLDFGRGDPGTMEYSFWCSKCQQTIGGTLKVKGQ